MPIYRRPWGAVLLIVLNTVLFAAGPQAEVVLVWGDGLHPGQWFLSTFAHASLSHLIGNMVFLWVFGLVVEGKVGLARFVAIFVGIGMAESALEQTIMLAAGVGVTGPSSMSSARWSGCSSASPW